jgi:hypothetical protein
MQRQKEEICRRFRRESHDQTPSQCSIVIQIELLTKPGMLKVTSASGGETLSHHIIRFEGDDHPGYHSERGPIELAKRLWMKSNVGIRTHVADHAFMIHQVEDRDKNKIPEYRDDLSMVYTWRNKSA